ncbi:MAG: FliA/WhiG family RNA polymerase sigma factor [Planctomycetaceae bacterium]|nr:RNA polymerase sigma factor FliA [Planctomycetota bacterium]MCQ3950677.1 FliA/WhiG family RNA polymerase sigma factor [Planctomycetota bacterium]NUO14892.1 FliA/WhiG family RNA polymerase sigma factor [Planctomycetaceae bacterium]GIK52382.1 MAG: RNA polymerase sigma factor [Planctomycetota bacterium]HRJ78174.1 FliA/WhiG family RNA polymerase sigma factor [Planctomycetota bacterium]
MPTLAPAPTLPRSNFSRASALLPKAYVVPTKLSQLTEADVEKLWREYKATGGDRLRNSIIECYLPLVRVVAERMHTKLPSHVDLDELIQAGVFGLMDAIDGFDPDRGVKFEAYCKQRISGAILDDLREQDFAPRLVRTHSHQLERAFKDLETALGRVPTEQEMADKLGISLDEYDRWLREINSASIVSLDRSANEGDSEGKEVRQIDSIEDFKTASPMSALEKKELIELATRGLSRKEKLVVVLYYLEELTMKEIGLVLDLSESRVCQIHHRIVFRLKRQLEKVREDLMG